MIYREFLADVRKQGEYENVDEAARVTEAVLATLGERLPPSVADHLADQLPTEIGEFITGVGTEGRTWGVQEFVHQVATAADDDEETARRHAETVLSTLGNTVSGGELNRLISALPAGYAELFGHAELA
ncbi:DUF2267 domain-containing protein [Streptomyces sp. TRM68367]|uniref:DUF2267 domain-containing protein n=1 Tax=Streptomyces sp. TRM68367 TaxID=2758415 RepID=UPI00165C0B43|nr:DUF2267 domain-containing protein [Streptomyces sp. TRM68367]MBC9724213.1 DUF2267 domain-containing protein [Streptomyces sp. TRM68367]